MTIIYDPALNHYKIEIDFMGHYTVTRMVPDEKRCRKFPPETESKYLQFEGDTAPFETNLKAIQVTPQQKRNWAYTELINSQFE